MKKIAVLIDFSEGSIKAFQQALRLSSHTKSTIWLIHMVAAKNKAAEAENKLTELIKTHAKESLKIEWKVGCGNIYFEINKLLMKLDPDIVLISTHGIKGFKQHIFGSNILKLVQSITFPCIVFQENSTTKLNDIKKILFPIGPDPDFMVKIKQTATIAKTMKAELVIYIINRPQIYEEKTFNDNVELAKSYFAQHEISYSVVKDDVKFASVGYSRQTIDYALINKIPLISQAAKVSKNDVVFGFGDKENFLVNEAGIPILTCNA
jgi:nucleotide-binding universal stress UspA family protein